jgi:hypothetical protein
MLAKPGMIVTRLGHEPRDIKQGRKENSTNTNRTNSHININKETDTATRSRISSHDRDRSSIVEQCTTKNQNSNDLNPISNCKALGQE